MPDLPISRLRRFVILIWGFAFGGSVIVLGGWLLSSGAPSNAFFIPAARTITIIETSTVSSTPPPPPASLPSQVQAPFQSSTPQKTSTADPTLTQTVTGPPFSEGPTEIGRSVEDRPLEVYRFGTGPAERLIVAGMHGGSEFNTIELADLLIAYLQEHPEVVPADATLYILRDLNPDGEARSHSYLGRANAHGVDLNRNWDANWHADWARQGCWIQTDVTGGKKPGSEPETQALMKFIEEHHLVAIINYHSAALGIFPGGLPPDEKSIRLAEALAAVSNYSYPPIDTGCQYTGGFVDWADLHGVAAVDLELTDHTSTDFEMNLKILNVFLNWKW